MLLLEMVQERSAVSPRIPLHWSASGVTVIEVGGSIFTYSLTLTSADITIVKMYIPVLSPFAELVRVIPTFLKFWAWYTLE